MIQASQTLVVGLGSAHGDDQIGWLVADRLASDAGRDVTVRRASSPLDLCGWLVGVQRLVVCDACHAHGKPGQIHRWSWPHDPLPARSSVSSHGIDLPCVFRLAETLDQLPPRVVVIGVEVETCRPAAEPSAQVLAAIPRAVAAVRGELVPVAPNCTIASS